MPVITLAFSLALPSLLWAQAGHGELRIGLVGTDGSHAVEFTRILHTTGSLRARVTAAVKASSAGLPRSAERVERIAWELQEKYQVAIVPAVRDLCPLADGILVLSIDGRTHARQMREVVRCGKPVYIDKPLADTVAGAREIARLVKSRGIMAWSSSSLRFAPEVRPPPQTSGIEIRGPLQIEPKFSLDLAYEGIHSVELAFALMGRGVATVSRGPLRNDPGGEDAGGEELAIGWRDGRVARLRLSKGQRFEVELGEGGGRRIAVSNGYNELLAEVLRSFRNGAPPVPLEETMEILKVLDAAQRSKSAGGRPVRLE